MTTRPKRKTGRIVMRCNPDERAVLDQTIEATQASGADIITTGLLMVRQRATNPTEFAQLRAEVLTKALESS